MEKLQRKYKKVAVIGMGNVGNAVAYGLVNQGLCNEILLINRNKKKAVGVALDLRQSIEYMNRNMRVWAGDFSEARSILHDECSVIPCSVYLDGQYQLHDVFTSTPCTISANGVQNIFELDLNDEELSEFHDSVAVIRASIEKCKELI